MNPTPAVAPPTATRRNVPIVADKNGAVPSRIEVLKAGVWPADSSKGMLIITEADLQEMVHNFDAGIGQPMVGFGLPIDFGHADYLEAAGWMKKLIVEGDTLFAEVEWTDKGIEALKGGRYKLFSPSFYPSCLGMWYDYEDPSISASNVLSGGGLTNIPFFKGLKPIMASRHNQNDPKNVIYVSADINKGESKMDVKTILEKDPTAVTTEEKAFLAENRNQLTGDQIEAFGVPEKAAETPEVPAPAPAPNADAPAPAATPTPTEVGDQTAEAITASLKSGQTVLVEASTFNAMKAQVEASAATIAGYERAKVEASVDEAIKRGAIKADQRKEWADKIEADRGLESLLTSLPSNQVIASELGKDDKGAGLTATDQLSEKIAAEIKASVDAGKPITYGQALNKVIASNTELAVERNQEFKG